MLKSPSSDILALVRSVLNTIVMYNVHMYNNKLVHGGSDGIIQVRLPRPWSSSDSDTDAAR